MLYWIWGYLGHLWNQVMHTARVYLCLSPWVNSTEPLWLTQPPEKVKEGCVCLLSFQNFLITGHCVVGWWHIFKPDQSGMQTRNDYTLYMVRYFNYIVLGGNNRREKWVHCLFSVWGMGFLFLGLGSEVSASEHVTQRMETFLCVCECVCVCMWRDSMKVRGQHQVYPSVALALILWGWSLTQHEVNLLSYTGWVASPREPPDSASWTGSFRGVLSFWWVAGGSTHVLRLSW